MKIAVIGSRDFKELGLIRDYLSVYKSETEPITVISGGAKGVDSEAIRVAKELGFNTQEYKPDFSQGYDVKQYHLRNDKIIEQADIVYAFWDGKSRGTASVIRKCGKLCKRYHVVLSPA